jgi:hypothetical protein
MTASIDLTEAITKRLAAVGFTQGFPGASSKRRVALMESCAIHA